MYLFRIERRVMYVIIEYMQEECLFCRIVSGGIPSEKVFEDEHTLGFLDINPINPGHTLIIPKPHYENLYELPDEIVAQMAINLKKIAIAVKEALGSDGVNILMNNDKPAGQLIGHAHFHVIPRRKGDGFSQWQGQGYGGGEIQKIGEKIRTSLG